MPLCEKRCLITTFVNPSHRTQWSSIPNRLKHRVQDQSKKKKKKKKKSLRVHDNVASIVCHSKLYNPIPMVSSHYLGHGWPKSIKKPQTKRRVHRYTYDKGLILILRVCSRGFKSLPQLSSLVMPLLIGGSCTRGAMKSQWYCETTVIHNTTTMGFNLLGLGFHL